MALATAEKAMRHWASGAASGDWSPLLAMFTPDITFQVPVEGFHGVHKGISNAARFFSHLTGAVRAKLDVTSTLADGDRVAFEVAVTGLWLGVPFTQRLCLVFAVRGGQICEFREYLAWPGGLTAAPTSAG